MLILSAAFFLQKRDVAMGNGSYDYGFYDLSNVFTSRWPRSLAYCNGECGPGIETILYADA